MSLLKAFLATGSIGDSIADGWSKLDFVKEILVRPMSSSATPPISELYGEIDSIQISLKLLFTLQQ